MEATPRNRITTTITTTSRSIRRPGRTASATPGCSGSSSRWRRSSLGARSLLTGFGGFWFLGPLLVFVAFPLLDIVVGMDATNPPDSVLKWLEQDRYYRWCTYLFIPIQYAGLILACWLWASGDLTCSKASAWP